MCGPRSTSPHHSHSQCFGGFFHLHPLSSSLRRLEALTFPTTLCSLNTAGTNHVTPIPATIPIQASATANPPHVHTGHCSSQSAMSSRHPPASVNHTLVSGHDPAAHTPSAQAACQPLLLGTNCKVSRLGKTPVKVQRKVFPSVRTGNLTMQGIWTLYSTKMDGLKMEKK